MPARTTYTPGTPCWVDCLPPDPAAAERFYGAVFGWTPGPELHEGYRLMLHGGAVACAIGAPPPDPRPVWAMYVRVEGLEAATARVAELGGTVLAGAFEVAGAGRVGVVEDPQGALVLLWEPGGFDGAAVVNEPGAWVWNDLQTPEPEAVIPFYEALFGWTITPVEASHGLYSSIAHEGRPIGGVMRCGPDVPRGWAVYGGVDDLDAGLERVAAAGGRLLVGPIPVPAGRFAMALDDQGALFGLIDGQFDG